MRALPPARRAVLALAVILSLVAAACGGGDPAEDPAGGEGSVAPPRDGAAPSEGADTTPDPGEPTGAGPTDADPTAQDPTALEPSPQDAGAAVPVPSGDAAAVDPTGGVQAVVAAMSLEQKVGQLFAVTVIGDHATDVSEAAARQNTELYGVATPAEVVQRYHLGGVAYFDHQQGEGTSNVTDLTRTAALSSGLQQAAAADTGIGLLIGVDQEGGPVVRLRAPATVFPAARDVAATGSLELAQQVATVTGTEALAVGVNWIYAPIADVNVDPSNPVIGDRAFGTTAAETTPWVLATARGIAAAGALATLKHFPGHGDTGTDSHTSLPTIDHDRATLEAVDFPPFAAGVDALDPISVMVGHLAVPSVDPSGRPATLSAPIIDLLRAAPADGGLGFDGLVVTDAMNMGALDGFGDAGALAVGAVDAGIDMVLMPTDLPAAWTAVLEAVQDGTIPMDRLDQAVARILRAKDAIGALDASAVPATDPTVLGNPAHARVLADVQATCGC